MDFFGYPLGAAPSAEDLGWIFAALIAIVFLAAVLIKGGGPQEAGCVGSRLNRLTAVSRTVAAKFKPLARSLMTAAPRRVDHHMVQRREAARLRLIVWCKACRHQAEPDVADLAEHYGADLTLPEWRARLVCSVCAPGRRGSLSGSKSRVRAYLRA